MSTLHLNSKYYNCPKVMHNEAKTNIFLVYVCAWKMFVFSAHKLAKNGVEKIRGANTMFYRYLWRRQALEWSLIFRTIRRRPTSALAKDNRTRMLLSSCVRTVMLSTSHATIRYSPLLWSRLALTTSEKLLTDCVHSPDNEELAHIQRSTQSKYWVFIDLT